MNISEKEFTKRNKFLTIKNTKHSNTLKKKNHKTKTTKNPILKSNQVQWHALEILALRKLMQEDYSKFEAKRGYTKRIRPAKVKMRRCLYTHTPHT